jgi:hypothetical protein
MAYFPRLKLSFLKEYGIILITKMDVEERGYGVVDWNILDTIGF